MTRTLVFAVFAGLAPGVAVAQSARIDLMAAAGASRVFRAEDQAFGTAFSPGAGVEWRVLPRMSLLLEVSHAAGLKPRSVLCPTDTAIKCTGGAREGVLSATTGSAAAVIYLGRHPRVRAFVSGGLGFVRSRMVSSVTFARGAEWTITESEATDTGMGVSAGAGLRITAGRWLMRPELRIYDGSVRGRANLAVLRTSVGVGYAW